MNKRHILALLTVATLPMYSMKDKPGLIDQSDCRDLNKVCRLMDNNLFEQAERIASFISNGTRRSQVEKILTEKINNTTNEVFKSIDNHKFKRGNNQKNDLPENKLTKKIQSIFLEQHSESIEGLYEVTEHDFQFLKEENCEEREKYKKLLADITSTLKIIPITKKERKLQDSKIVELSDNLKRKIDKLKKKEPKAESLLSKKQKK